MGLKQRGTFADREVIRQVFEERQYALDGLARQPELLTLYARAAILGQRPLIVDAGANIGASVRWWTETFPAAHVVALEPEPENFALLTENCGGSGAELYRAAIGAEAGSAALVDPGIGAWGYRLDPAAAGPPTTVMSADALVAAQIAAGFLPFIFKIDIEGGEQYLFEKNLDWVDHFPLIIIELHDWLLPGRGTSGPFLRAIAARDRDFVYRGENVFSIRNVR